MEPMITIAMCVKNAESVVKRAIDSVLLQDYPHERMELIVVDGSSTDKTVDIIKTVLDSSNVKGRFFSEWKGLGYARQVAVDNASGDYIVWVDGDIILSSDYVTQQVEYMEMNPMAGVAGGKFGELPCGTLPAILENLVYVATSSVQAKETKSRILAGGGDDHRFVGTEGSIYRVSSLRQVGGFDINIAGAFEDVELAYRLRKAGWKLERNSATFYESCRESWKALWDQYVWYGYGGYYIFHKDSKMIRLYEMLPQTGLFVGLLYSIIAYRLTRRKVCFLLPLHYFFKRIAWWFGFIKGRAANYGKDVSGRI